MAEFEFFADEEEILEVVNWLLGQRCKLVPGVHYDSPIIKELVQPQEIKIFAQLNPQLFVIREELLESPLKLRKVTSGDTHFFYIDPQTGGPHLQFFWGGYFEKEGRHHLAATSLSYYSWYQDSLTGQRKKVSKELLKIYSNCVKAIRKNRRMIQPGVRKFFVSPRVERLVRSGTVLVGLEAMAADEY